MTTTHEAKQRRKQEEQLLVPETSPVALMRALRHILDVPEGHSVLEHAAKVMRRYRTCWPKDAPGGRVCVTPQSVIDALPKVCEDGCCRVLEP